ncbi:putative ribonuclease H protein [Glycine max]|nr:putative ribonuclease H protein [Glycine max]
MNILSLNSRGLGSGVKRSAIRKLTLANNVDLLCIQETKKESIDKAFCQYLWGDANVSWEAAPSNSAAGGLLCLWNNDSFVVDRRVVGRGYIWLEGVWTKENKRICITNLYAPCDLQGKRQQWEEIKLLKPSFHDGPWCIAGDFNSIRHHNERISSSQSVGNSSCISEFNSWISDMALEEVRSVGRNFTWVRPNGSAMSKLDRFLLSDDWLIQWPDSTQFVLDRDFSDHCPILLRSTTVDWGPRPFKVMDWWLQDKEFQKMVSHRWTNYHPSGWGGYALKLKLKFIKGCIRQWSLQNGAINVSKIQDLKKKLNDLEAGSNTAILSQAEVELKKSLQEQLWSAALAYESMLRQKSRIKWIREGDRNTAYFHRVINHRRRINAIQGLLIAGEWVQEPIRVKNAVLNHFKLRFSEQNPHRPTLDGVVLKSVLRIFEMVSGLKINYTKSQVGCMGKSEDWCREAALFLNCGQLDIPFPYLGIPVGTTSKCWNDLRIVFQQHHRICISNYLKWRVGDGNTIKFWEDRWREADDLSLQQKYPTLYQVSMHQNQTISSMGILSGNSWEWQIQWRRHFFDHEIDTMAAFMADIEGIQIQPLSRDFLSWRADPAGYYSTMSAYYLLKAEDSPNPVDSNYKTIWSLHIPPRASAFTWRILKNRLPTRDNLRRRNVELPSYNCPLCDQEGETVGHIMYSCRKTCHLWWETLRWVNRMGPFSLQPNCHLLQFSQWSGKRNVDNRWKALWIALSMTIWKHRNALVFNNQDFCSEKVMDEALFLTWSWINCMEKGFHIHFNQWSSCLKEEMS